MPLFPPGTPVAVLLDGHPLAAYERAYLADGRVYAPVSPLLTRLADRLWIDGTTLIVERGARRVRVPLLGDYVMIGPVLRAIGAPAQYDPATSRLTVFTPPRSVVNTPTPFDPAAPHAAPTAVFTPLEPATPRPVWSGSPLPRRTPLPRPPPDRR